MRVSQANRAPVRGLGAAVVAVALAGLLFSPTALAKKTGLYAGVKVKTSNGYSAYISAERWKHPRRRGRVWVNIQKGNALSSYMARATLTRRHLKANLGRFGEISLRYRQTNRHRALESKALESSGDPLANYLFQRLIGCAVIFDGATGQFRGRIRFRGEGGYTRVRAGRAHGFIEPATLNCSQPHVPHGVALDAGSGSLRFEADHFRGQTGALFIAFQTEQVGAVTVRRLALDTGPEGSFTYAPDLSTAHVAPPKDAFSGSADFTSPEQWIGMLKTSFPGDPDLSLAGAQFTARLRRF